MRGGCNHVWHIIDFRPLTTHLDGALFFQGNFQSPRTKAGGSFSTRGGGVGSDLAVLEYGGGMYTKKIRPFMMWFVLCVLIMYYCRGMRKHANSCVCAWLSEELSIHSIISWAFVGENPEWNHQGFCTTRGHNGWVKVCVKVNQSLYAICRKCVHKYNGRGQCVLYSIYWSLPTAQEPPKMVSNCVYLLICMINTSPCSACFLRRSYTVQYNTKSTASLSHTDTSRISC